MDEKIKIISETILEFQDSGRTSTTALARCIIGELESKGYVIKKPEPKNPDTSFYCNDSENFKFGILERCITQCEDCK